MSSSPETPRPSICEPRTLADQVSSPHLDIINYPAAQTIRVVAELLENIIVQNDKLPSGALTHFHSRSVPKIPVHAYLTRIQKFAPFSNEVLITILVYFDRIARRHTSFVISSFNIHRLLITRGFARVRRSAPTASQSRLLAAYVSYFVGVGRNHRVKWRVHTQRFQRCCCARNVHQPTAK
ncbi:hypothetical protein NQZ79_g8678 [Umbelopsis isabellina]|nr:hypothetical protein NQZ79_g8678 [Umbelopsis isabellina]